MQLGPPLCPAGDDRANDAEKGAIEFVQGTGGIRRTTQQHPIKRMFSSLEAAEIAARRSGRWVEGNRIPSGAARFGGRIEGKLAVNAVMSESSSQRQSLLSVPR
jgi:hypothetical protein